MNFKVYSELTGEDHEYRLSFIYTKHSKGKLKNMPYQTTAVLRIKFGDEWAIVGTGSATCVKGDQFDRRIGRKLAVTNMLKNIPSRDFRTALWQAFISSVKMPDQMPVSHDK